MRRERPKIIIQASPFRTIKSISANSSKNQIKYSRYSITSWIFTFLFSRVDNNFYRNVMKLCFYHNLFFPIHMIFCWVKQIYKLWNESKSHPTRILRNQGVIQTHRRPIQLDWSNLIMENDWSLIIYVNSQLGCKQRVPIKQNASKLIDSSIFRVTSLL